VLATTKICETRYQLGTASKHLIHQQPQYSAVRNLDPATDGPNSNSPISTFKEVWSDCTSAGKQSEGTSTCMDYKTARASPGLYEYVFAKTSDQVTSAIEREKRLEDR